MAGNAAHTHTQNLLSLLPSNKISVNVDLERLLKNVHKDDKTTIQNVITTMYVLRTHELVSNVEVVPHRIGYDVIGTLSKSLEKELILTSSDFEIIQSVSPARINTIMVQVSNNALELVVRVFSHDTPIMYSSVQITHINKRRRLG
jgi:hypothetical protein